MIGRPIQATDTQLHWDYHDILVANDYRERGWPSFLKNTSGEVVAVAENVAMLKGHPVFKSGLTIRASYLTRELHLQLRLCSGEGTDQDVFFSGRVPELADKEANLGVVLALAGQIYKRVVAEESLKSIRDNVWVGCDFDWLAQDD